MAFQASPSDAVKPPRVELRSVSKTTFELMTPFAYVSAAGEVIPVPAHPNEWATDTDLASVPPLLWGLLASYGRQLRAAIFHDHLCDKVNRAVENGDDQAYASRRHADNLFREAMRDKGEGSDEDLQKRVPWFRSWLFWAGFSFGRYWQFRKVRALLMSLQVLVGSLVLDFLVPLPILNWVSDRLPWELPDLGSAALLWSACLALSVVWWRDWRIPLIGLLAGPLLIPVLIITFLVQVILGIPDAVLHLVRSSQPKGAFGPTVDKVAKASLAPPTAK